jgi:hypothetical protein
MYTSPNHCSHENASKYCLFILYGLHVAANKVGMFIVAIETQQTNSLCIVVELQNILFCCQQYQSP